MLNLEANFCATKNEFLFFPILKVPKYTVEFSKTKIKLISSHLLKVADVKDSHVSLTIEFKLLL